MCVATGQLGFELRNGTVSFMVIIYLRIGRSIYRVQIVVQIAMAHLVHYLLICQDVGGKIRKILLRMVDISVSYFR